MATRGQMVEQLAHIFGVSENAVDVLDRGLAAAGLRTKSLRGRAATKMTAQDVAHDTIALCLDASIRDTPELVDRISKIELKGGRSWEYVDAPDAQDERSLKEYPRISAKSILHGGPLHGYPRKRLPMASTFGASLASLIEHLPDLDDMGRMEVTIRKELPGAQIFFKLGEQNVVLEFGKGIHASSDLGINSSKWLEKKPLMLIAGIVRDRDDAQRETDEVI